MEQILRGEIYGDEMFSYEMFNYVSIRLDDAPLWLELARAAEKLQGHWRTEEQLAVLVGGIDAAIDRLQEDTE